MKYWKKITALALAAVLLAGCTGKTEETVPETTEEIITEPTYSAVNTGSGNKLKADCKGEYTADSVDGSRVIATMGEETLTVQQLQIWYRMAVAAHMTSGDPVKPDMEVPLFAQSCGLSSGLSWEQYFLQKAVESWEVCAALVLGTREPQLITEVGYTPSPTRLDYIDPKKPVWDILYQDRECYKPNSVHQAYLDGMPETLRGAARALGYDGTDAMAQAIYGVSGTALLEYARYYNLAYMYYTELSYNVKATREEMDTWLAIHPEADGNEEKIIDLRQALFIPDQATVDPNGKVTALEKDWLECMQAVADHVREWRSFYMTQLYPQPLFANIANNRSQDKATAPDGGFLNGIRKGELIGVLDSWCFDAERKAGDADVLESEYGVIAAYISDIRTVSQQTAEEAVVREKLAALVDELKERYPMEADYSMAALTQNAPESALTAESILYADVAHQHFPEPMVYFQQDYYTVKYGAFPLHSNGCGITTYAMMATYLGDEVCTPYDAAKMYGSYSLRNGTNGQIFEQVTANQNFYFESRCYEWKDVEPALRAGKTVVSVQHKGYFTSSGHYLMLWKMTDEGKVVVRDSNQYNYGKKEGHKVDYFEIAQVNDASSGYWIFQPKILTLPACSRCGDGSTTYALNGGHYLCRKCAPAVERRTDFLMLSGT